MDVCAGPALDRLRTTEQRLRLALQVAKVGSWEWDLVTDVVEWTDELYRFYGVDVNDFEPSYAGFISLVHSDDRPMVERTVAASIATGAPFDFDHRVIGHDGDITVMHARGELIKDIFGNAVRLVGTVQDVTLARRREAALAENEVLLRESEERALLASRHKSQFLAYMSHEIRTPLNGFVGMTELLSDSSLAPTQRRYVGALRGAAQSLLTLLNDILDLSKVEAGKVNLEIVDCHLPTVIDETVTLFGVAADAKGVELRADTGEGVPKWVRIDATRLKQVIGNLLGNAVKFTERGTVTLACEAVGSRLRFTVADTGIGIDQEDHERLMSPFEQGNVSTARRFGGTGLGLAICRELTTLMGGDIRFESALGVGTTFTVDLPLEPGTPPATQLPSGPRCTSHAKRVGRRVLLAEDTPISQLVANAMLEKLGWEVVVVDDGRQAVDTLARDDAFDLVILDCQMPVLDGYSAARAIRQMAEPTCRIPILAMTASALPADRQRCLDAGMDEYVTKPITRATLGEAMNRLMDAPRGV
ncbi:MAG TPA: ATP-binding protein [Acidimicrobiales bacterium]|nr:ATP-binding protein [Acidimicrobiales bacterium]